jgi:hypothetical protein
MHEKTICALCLGKELILHNWHLHNQWAAQKGLSTIDSTVTDKTTLLLYKNEGALQNQKFQTLSSVDIFPVILKIG